MEKFIDKLETNRSLTKEEWVTLLSNRDDKTDSYIFERSDFVRKKHYGNKVFIRGLIEISNYCKNDCYYCGIRKSNKNLCRYRLNKEEILASCEEGEALGFRTFVLQGGEDPYFNDAVLCDIIADIKKTYSHCAVTLSLGERSYESYKVLYEAGADRYLLRHETANQQHYEKLHPKNLELENRIACLKHLKEIGFQTGTGIMVGSPFQTMEHIAEDLILIKELNPEMVGIGPFISHHDTPFASYENGSVFLTLFLLAALRLMLPTALLPSTTALNTIGNKGRERGILAGANVVMPNLSPDRAKNNYTLYDHKLISGAESAQLLKQLKEQMKAIGYEVVVDRGDFQPLV